MKFYLDVSCPRCLNSMFILPNGMMRCANSECSLSGSVYERPKIEAERLGDWKDSWGYVAADENKKDDEA